MTALATFRFLAGTGLVVEIPLPPPGEVESEWVEEPIGELQDCSFSVEPAEPAHRYLLRVGDMLADRGRDDSPTESPGEGHAFPGSSQWAAGQYFESARGDTALTLLSRRTDGDGVWRRRLEARIRIVPTKLGEDRYEAMYQALSRLSLSFVHDLISKSAVRLGLDLAEVRTPVQSAQVRLRLIENLWTALAPALAQIERSPVTVLKRSNGRTRLWGGENLRSRAIAALAERGFSRDPRELPLKSHAFLLSESADTFEHQVIKGFLRRLLAHLMECADDARANVQALRVDRVMLRDFPDAVLRIDESVEKLEKSIESAETRESQIRAARASQPFSRLRAESHPRRTPVFENVMPYRRVWNLMQQYSNRSAIIVGSDVSQRVKATSKMYEQWVFFQCAAAIRALGCRCEEEVGVLQQKSRYRFTLNLDYGSRLSFAGPHGEIVTITYQPLIYGYLDAAARRDTLFRGQVATPWSPDILIEVLDKKREPGKPPQVLHALILDAKYSARLMDHHWAKVAKYAEIRSTATRAAVVRQVWIAYPGREPEIIPRDDFVEWGLEGPTVGPDETVLGSVALIPHVFDDPVPGDPIADEPSPILLEFLRAMLLRFGVRTGLTLEATG